MFSLTLTNMVTRIWFYTIYQTTHKTLDEEINTTLILSNHQTLNEQNIVEKVRSVQRRLLSLRMC